MKECVCGGLWDGTGTQVWGRGGAERRENKEQKGLQQTERGRGTENDPNRACHLPGEPDSQGMNSV